MRAWAVRWRTALRIARREARRHKGRTALVVTMLSLPVAAMVFLAMVYLCQYPGNAAFLQENLGTSLQAQLTVSGCKVRQDVRAIDQKCTDGKQIDPTPFNELASILPADDVLEPAYQGSPTMTHGKWATSASLSTVGPKTMASLRQPISGLMPTKAGEIALPADVAETIHATVGDTISLTAGQDNQQRATVVALFPASKGPVVEIGALMLGTGSSNVIGTENMAYVAGPAPITWPMVQTLNADGYSAISRSAIEHPPADAPATPGPYTAYSGGFNAMAAAVVAIVLIEVIMIIGPAFAVGARRSRQQLAMVAVVGGSAADLRRIVRAGGVVQGIAAGILGGALGMAVGLVLYLTAFADQWVNLMLPWREWLLATAVTTILGVCAAWMPSRAAGRADPLPALAGVPEPPPATHRAWAAPVCAGIAIVIVLVAVMAHQPAAVLVGAIGLEIALVLAVSPSVARLARLGTRLRLIPRIVLRDASRQRTRTAPAIAAVIVCVAGCLLGGTYSDASQRAQDSTYTMPADWGDIGIARGDAQSVEALAQTRQNLHKVLPSLQIVPVSVAASTTKGEGVSVVPEVDQSRCDKPIPTKLVKDCQQLLGQHGSGFSWSINESGTNSNMTLVDDGTFVAANGLPGAAKAAQALRDGKAVVNTPLALDAHGNVKLVAEFTEPGTGKLVQGKTVTMPGYVVPWQDMSYQTVIPTQRLAKFDLTAMPAGFLGVPSSPISSGQRAEIIAAQHDGGGVSFMDKPKPDNITQYLMAILAMVVGAAACWIAVGLAAVDSGPDVPTLAAVGAAPRTRRRLAAAQAWVIAGIGAIPGVLSGLVLAAAMIWYQGQLPANIGMTWSLHVSWPSVVLLLIGIPLVAVLGAGLFTRSRPVPVARRE